MKEILSITNLALLTKVEIHWGRRIKTGVLLRWEFNPTRGVFQLAGLKDPLTIQDSDIKQGIAKIFDISNH